MGYEQNKTCERCGGKKHSFVVGFFRGFPLTMTLSEDGIYEQKMLKAGIYKSLGEIQESIIETYNALRTK